MAQRFEMNLVDYWRIIKKRKWVIVVSTLTLVILVYLFTSMQKPIYRSFATVKIEQKKNIAGLLEDFFTSGSGDILATETEIIKSYEIAEKVVYLLGLGKDYDENSSEYKSIVESIRARIFTERVPNTNIIKINYSDGEPERAMRIVNEIVNVYVTKNTSDRKQEARNSREFISEQLDQVKERLAKAEQQLQDFKESEKIASVDVETNMTLEAGSKFKIEYEAVQTEKDLIRMQIKEAKDNMRKSGLETEQKSITSDPIIANLKDRLANLELKRSSFLLNLTSKHPDVQNVEREIGRLKNQISEQARSIFGGRLAELEATFAMLEVKENALYKYVNDYEKDLLRLPKKEVAVIRLKRDVEVNEQVYKFLQEKYEEARIKEAGKTGDASVVDYCIKPPSRPVKPNKTMNVVLGFMIGVILGGVLSFVIENFDTSIGTIEDVEDHIQLPVLGVIPRIIINEDKFKSSQGKLPISGISHYQQRLVTIYDSASPVAEAYRTLRTNLEFAGLKKGKKTIMITSSTPQEGKTTTVSNLAVVMAQKGIKTLLVGTNLRRPVIHRIFGIKRDPGLTDVLIGAVSIKDTIHTTAVENLYIIPAGPLPTNPSELLDSKEMEIVIGKLKENFEVVLFDSPPVLPVVDASIIASKVDGVLLVYYVGRIGREALLRATTQLNNVHASILGVALNNVQAESDLGSSYYSRYYRYYGEEEKVPKRV